MVRHQGLTALLCTRLTLKRSLNEVGICGSELVSTPAVLVSELGSQAHLPLAAPELGLQLARGDAPGLHVWGRASTDWPAAA